MVHPLTLKLYLLKIREGARVGVKNILREFQKFIQVNNDAECHHCQKTGHIKKDSFKWKRQQQKDKGDQETVATTSEDVITISN